MKGYIHSYETFATLDGGGIRGMVFLCGCAYRCAYCHNPDTWATKGTLAEASEVVAKLGRHKNYYKNGGITVSGGEPLLQSEFCLEMLKGFKAIGLHTAIDTSGQVFPENIDELLDYTDLVILDLKFADELGYNKYCKGSMSCVTKLISKLNERGTEVLLRTVIVPDINDSEQALDNYITIASQIANLKEYELLGYHTLGVDKYTSLGIDYPLQGVKALDEDRLVSLQNYVNMRLK